MSLLYFSLCSPNLFPCSFFFFLKCSHFECIGSSMTTEMKGSLCSAVQKFSSLSRLLGVYVTLKAMKVKFLVDAGDKIYIYIFLP